MRRSKIRNPESVIALALRVLRRLAGPLQAVLLAFLGTGIAGQAGRSLQHGAQFSSATHSARAMPCATAPACPAGRRLRPGC